MGKEPAGSCGTRRQKLKDLIKTEQDGAIFGAKYAQDRAAGLLARSTCNEHGEPSVMEP